MNENQISNPQSGPNVDDNETIVLPKLPTPQPSKKKRFIVLAFLIACAIIAVIALIIKLVKVYGG